MLHFIVVWSVAIISPFLHSSSFQWDAHNARLSNLVSAPLFRHSTSQFLRINIEISFWLMEMCWRRRSSVGRWRTEREKKRKSSIRRVHANKNFSVKLQEGEWKLMDRSSPFSDGKKLRSVTCITREYRNIKEYTICFHDLRVSRKVLPPSLLVAFRVRLFVQLPPVGDGIDLMSMIESHPPGRLSKTYSPPLVQWQRAEANKKEV